MLSIEDALYIECPLVTSLDGHNFPSRRLARLAGIPIELARFENDDGQTFAVFNISSIVTALQGSPERFYWKGRLDSLQPRSYGVRQAETIDPELSFPYSR